MGVYIVQKGDTLSAIAGRLAGDKEAWRDIASNNALKNPNRLQVGQRLEIPGYEPEKAEEANVPSPRLRPNVEAEGIPEPRPRPNITKVATPPERPVGSLPAAEETTKVVAPPERPIGSFPAAEEAIPEEASLAQVLKNRGLTGVTETMNVANDPFVKATQSTAPVGSLTPNPRPRPDSGGLLQRGVTRPTEEAGPDFSMASNPAQALPEGVGQETDIGVNFANADPGEELTLTPEQMARFQPEQADKVNEVLRMFFREPNLIDEVLQSIGVTSPAAAEQ